MEIQTQQLRTQEKLETNENASVSSTKANQEMVLLLVLMAALCESGARTLIF